MRTEPLTRRAFGAVTAAVALLGLTACTEDDGTAGPVLPVDSGADPDVALAVAAWTAESALLQQVRAVQRRHRRLRRRLEPVRRVHAGHAEVLARAVPTDELPAVPPAEPVGRPAAALRSLARDEDALARAQAGRAIRARSGPLARLLAGTAAAAAQQAHLLAREAA